MAAQQASPSLEITANREALLARLGEAAEIEHCLMCTYLYAAFSLKPADSPEFTPAQSAAVARWRSEIFAVAREEMAHLLLVSNLLTALGGSAHFGRMNFPLPAGYLPADMQVRLAPFDLETVQHFVWLERPAGSDEPMGAGFAPTQRYTRGGPPGQRLMPHAVDYDTVGALYAMIVSDLEQMCARLGESAVFVGDPAGQVSEALVHMPNVQRVVCLKTAKAAIQAIVEQGEAARADAERSHFQRFCAVRDELSAMLAADPGFKPAYPAAHNPVMRRPPTPEGKVWIEAEAASAVVDLANALYLHMLRLLAGAFGRGGDGRAQAALIDAAIDVMFAITPTAHLAATLPARPGDDGCTAGMSFAMSRSLAPLPTGGADWAILSERFDEIAAQAQQLAQTLPALREPALALQQTAQRFSEQGPLFRV